MLRRILVSTTCLGLLAAIGMGLWSAPPVVPPVAPVPGSTISLVDGFGYVWDLTVTNADDSGTWLKGTASGAIDPRVAIGAFDNQQRTLVLDADEGITGIGFVYNLSFNGPAGAGIWSDTNDIAAPNNGVVTITVNSSQISQPQAEPGPRPGIPSK